MTELEQGDVVLCTVDRIERTTVFVKLFDKGKKIEGSIITSEIAPGRIRNLRNYVVPKKKIVCKVLRVLKSGHIELSLRRVTPKERKEVMDRYKQEKSYISIIKSVLGDKAESAINEISEEGVFDFFEEAKENPKKLERIIGKSNTKNIVDILLSQKQKKFYVKKIINLKIFLPNGIEAIKKTFENIKNAEIRYISAGKYSIKTEADDIKKADNEIRLIASEIEGKTKGKEIEFSIAEK